MSETVGDIVVIFDGQCELCRNSIHWIQKKLSITALDFHVTDLSILGLTKEQCASEVFVIDGDSRLSGAQAVAFLLKRRGNRILSGLVTISGPLARFVYRWIAAHRNSVLVKILSNFLKR